MSQVVKDYLRLEVICARKGMVKQSMKLNEWARHEFEKNRGKVNEVNGTR